MKLAMTVALVVVCVLAVVMTLGFVIDKYAGD